jgi:hypothetical protein
VRETGVLSPVARLGGSHGGHDPAMVRPESSKKGY